MITKLVALTVLPMLLVGGVVMNSSIMLVDVDTDDVRIVVPVPLSLAQVAVAFAPNEAKYARVPELAHYLPYVDRLISELREIPDALLVEVIDGNDHVRVAKQGDQIEVEVEDGRRTHVRASVPLASVAAIVDAYDVDGGYFRTSRIVGALRAAPSGDLVHVIDGDDEIRIRMW